MLSAGNLTSWSTVIGEIPYSLQGYVFTLERGLCCRKMSIRLFVSQMPVFCRNSSTYHHFFPPSGSHTTLVLQSKVKGQGDYSAHKSSIISR